MTWRKRLGDECGLVGEHTNRYQSTYQPTSEVNINIIQFIVNFETVETKPQRNVNHYVGSCAQRTCCVCGWICVHVHHADRIWEVFLWNLNNLSYFIILCKSMEYSVHTLQWIKAQSTSKEDSQELNMNTMECIISYDWILLNCYYCWSLIRLYPTWRPLPVRPRPSGKRSERLTLTLAARRRSSRRRKILT